MARLERKNEDYLDDVEPIAVVILNDVANLVEDMADIMEDLARLQRKRPNDFKTLLETLTKAQKEGPQVLLGTLPKDVGEQTMAATMSMFMTFASVKNNVVAPAGAAEDSQKPAFGVDPQKMNPNDLDLVGKALKEASGKIQKAIGDFEKKLLKEKVKK